MNPVNDNEPELAITAVDRRDPAALHDQVAAAIRGAIAGGEAGPGDRIPQVRDLAAVLGVNKNTVLRALRILREEGLLEMGRGRAIRVTGTPVQSTLITKANELIQLARAQGYRREDLTALIHRLS